MPLHCAALNAKPEPGQATLSEQAAAARASNEGMEKKSLAKIGRLPGGAPADTSQAAEYR